MKITKNGKEIEIAENELYDYVIQEAVNRTKENFPKNIALIADDSGAPRAYSLETFSKRLFDKTEEFITDMGDYSKSLPQTNTAYACNRALNIMYNLCVASEVGRNIDEVVNEINIPQDAKKEISDNLQNYYNELVDNTYKKPTTKRLLNEMKTALDGHSNNREQMKHFLNQGVNYIEEVCKNLFEKGESPEDALDDAINGLGAIKAFDATIIPTLHEAIADYKESFGNDFNMYISYGNDDKVKPLDFLKRYEENKLTPEDKAWAGKHIQDIETKLQAGIAGNINWADYKADGFQLFSDKEIAEAKGNNEKTADLNCKLLSTILSGKDVSVSSGEKDLHINPEVSCTTPMNVLEEFLEILAEFLHISTERQKIKALNESLGERKEMSFNELIEKDPLANVTAPPKNFVDEKSKELGSKVK